MQVDLNDRYLRNLQAPENGRMEVSDIKRKGLRFRLSSKGNAVWMYEKRVKGGMKRKHTLGAWPAVTLSDARATALEIEAEAAKGVDRITIAEVSKLAEEAARAGLSTIQQVIDTYDKLHLTNLRTGVERKRVIERALSKHLGKSIADLTRKDIQEAVDAKAMEGHKIYANRIRGMLLALTNWAWERGYVENPIGIGISKATREVARDRVLSISEIQQIWEVTFRMGNLWGPMLRLLLLTGQRRGEIARLRWEEINLETGQITKPGSQTKNGKPQITHLSHPAILELEALGNDATGYLFTTTGKTPVSGFSPMKRTLDKLLGDDFTPWRIHDIRTAMATALANAGEPETVVDRILNHVASGSAPSAVARVYNQAEQLPQRAKALDKWAEMVTGEVAKIVSIHGV